MALIVFRRRLPFRCGDKTELELDQIPVRALKSDSRLETDRSGRDGIGRERIPRGHS